MKYKNIKQIVKAIVPVGLVGTIIGTAIGFSQPDYREFVSINNENSAYHLNIKENKTSVEGRYGVYGGSIVDEDGDLKPDYSEVRMVANVRAAKRMRKKPTLEEIDLFKKVIEKSKRFGDG